MKVYFCMSIGGWRLITGQKCARSHSERFEHRLALRAGPAAMTESSQRLGPCQ